MGAGLDILNVGLGDLKIRFDSNNAGEIEKAKKMIGNLLRDGYAICVERKDGSYQRVKRFSAKRDCYIVSEVVDGEEAGQQGKGGQGKAKGAPKSAARGARRRTRDVDVPRGTSRAVAIGRSAGG